MINDPAGEGADKPGATSQTKPPIATMRPNHCSGCGRSPLMRPLRIIVTCTAINRISAPVPVAKST
jgi:hypothetical protein